MLKLFAYTSHSFFEVPQGKQSYITIFRYPAYRTLFMIYLTLAQFQLNCYFGEIMQIFLC